MNTSRKSCIPIMKKARDWKFKDHVITKVGNTDSQASSHTANTMNVYKYTNISIDTVAFI